MIRIPKRLLIHSATLKVYSKDWTQDKETSVDTLLTNVRYERVTKLNQTSKTNKDLALKATLWYDSSNSSPKGVNFVEGQIIEFEGVPHTIEVINYYYDDKGLGHEQLGLV